MSAGSPSAAWAAEGQALPLPDPRGGACVLGRLGGTAVRRPAESGPEPLDRLIGACVAPQDRRRIHDAIAEALRERRALDLELRVVRADGTVGWIRSRCIPLLGPAGEVGEWLGAIEDVTERHEALDRLREQEERLRLTLGLARLSTWDWNLETHEVGWSETHFRNLGYEPGEVPPSRKAWADRVHPDDRPAFDACFRDARDHGRPCNAEFRVTCADRPPRWFHARGKFLPREEGGPRRMAGIMQDITAVRMAGAQHRQGQAEVQRRLRNNLAMLRAVVRRSAWTATGVEDFASHMEGRLAALARAASAAGRPPGAGLDLEAVLRDEFRAAAAAAGQVILSGPRLRVNGQAGEMLALALHELTTNAIKHGALASPEGTVAVEWSLHGDGTPRLRLLWSERAAHPLAPPGPPGFGTDLLERMLTRYLGATTRIEHGPTGYSCAIEIPLPAPDG